MHVMDPVPAELDRAIRDAVDVSVGQFGGAVAAIRRDQDIDGDDCLIVEIDYSQPQEPIDPRIVAGLNHLLGQVAYAAGERRILYVHNRFHNDQRVLGTHAKFWLGDGPRERSRP